MASSPDGPSSTATPTGSSGTGAPFTIFRPTRTGADKASAPPSSTNSEGSPETNWGWNNCISPPEEAKGWRSSTDGSAGVRSAAGPGALRLAPDDTRDEVLMILAPL
ncbi:hypothetical protein GCM10009560_29790 [Nonomuraea longicatena]|uniref:Uncharacterized protein n=1 Tax=Nonomuraea longicatena TaxID=83682 RepID=A0ABP3ZUC0_9ACTN